MEKGVRTLEHNSGEKGGEDLLKVLGNGRVL
jgi:hypothetical protein